MPRASEVTPTIDPRATQTVSTAIGQARRQDVGLSAWLPFGVNYTLAVDGKENRDAAWYYPDPKDAASNIKGMVAFWRGVEVTG